MKAVDVLKAARAHLSDPENWYKGEFTNPDDENCMCAWGALIAFSVGGYQESYDILGDAIPHDSFSVASYNDAIEHPKLLTWFDKAIELAEAKS